MSELELEIKTMRIVFGAQLQALGGVSVANGNINQMSIAQQVAAAVSLRNSSAHSNHNHNSCDSMDRQQQPNESTPLSSRSTRNHLNIKYGVLNEQESALEVLPGGVLLNDNNDKEAQEMELMEKLCAKYNYGKNSIKTNGTSGTAAVPVTTMADDSDSQVVVQMEKDTFDLRRELQDAVAGKKSAEQRIVT